MEQPLAAADDTDPPVRDAGIHERQPGGEHVQAALLLPPFGAAGVAADPPGPAADRGSQPHPETADAPLQAGPLFQQVAIAVLPLVLAGAGDRTRPATGRGGRQRPLSAGPVGITNAEAAALAQIAAGQPPQVLADLAHHHLVGGRDPQPRADARTRRGRNHERRGDGTKPAGHRGDCLPGVELLSTIIVERMFDYDHNPHRWRSPS